MLLVDSIRETSIDGGTKVSALFQNFAAASAHAREHAASSNQVIRVYPEEDQWAVQPLDEDPTYWMAVIQDEYPGLESHSIEAFLEYEAANDETFA
jgi:hypothetical protein